MAHDVFISHSAHNREVADAICEALEKTGIRCWVAPRDVRPGRSFPGEITRAIQQSKVMVMVFSSHSNNSEQVLREIQLATDSRLIIIRFRIEDVALTDDLRYFLSSPHWLDALTPPLSKHIERLQLAIKELLDQSVEVTGKDVTADDVAVAAPPVTPVATPPAVTPITTPPAPVEAAPIMPPPLPVAAPAQKRPEPVNPKSFNPWPLLAIAAVVICAAIIGVIFLVARQSVASKQQQASTAPAQSAQTPVATTKRPSPPTTKVTQNTPPPKAPKATPAPDVQSSTESEPTSAFERAGSLKRPTESKSARKKDQKKESKSAFDRAGGNIGPNEPETEPSPDD